MTLVVGAHPQNLSLSLLARRVDEIAALRECGLSFFLYGAGSQTIPLFEAGVLQLGGTGATPPILAKARGLGVAAFGMSGARRENGGLCVRAESSARTVADLKGRGIGLMPVSWHTQFLASELALANLTWQDVRAVEIIPETAAAAFVAGLLDAIVITDPLYSKVKAQADVRVLASPGNAFSNRSVYWGDTATLRDHPEAVKALFEALQRSDAATLANPEEAATLLDGLNGNTAKQWQAALSSRPWGVDAPDEAFAAEQQAHADLFAEFGLIPHRIDVSDTIDRRFAGAR